VAGKSETMAGQRIVEGFGVVQPVGATVSGWRKRVKGPILHSGTSAAGTPFSSSRNKTSIAGVQSSIYFVCVCKQWTETNEAGLIQLIYTEQT
jgi:hypothetical protein